MNIILNNAISIQLKPEKKPISKKESIVNSLSDKLFKYKL